jgi:hypothetical protein
MGNQQSRSDSISEIVNSSITNVMMERSSNCSSNNSLSQEIVFNNIKSGPGCNLKFSNISQKSLQAPNFSCSSDSQNDSDLTSKFMSELNQKAATAVAGIGGALNSEANSQTISKLKNQITNNIKVSQISQCVQNTIADQKQMYSLIEGSCPKYCDNPSSCVAPLIAAGMSPSDPMLAKMCDVDKCTMSFDNITQNLTQKAVGNCVSKDANITKAVDEASTQLEQTTSSKNTGWNPSVMSASYMVVCVVFMIIFAIVFLKFILPNMNKMSKID